MELASMSVTLAELPFSVAVSMAAWLLFMPARMEKRALVDPAAMVTELGKVSEDALAACIMTFTPPAGAGADRLTWQVVELCGARVVVLQVSPATVTEAGDGGARVSEKFCEVPFSVVTSTAVLVELTADAVAVKPAAFAPAGTTTDDGIDTADPDARPVAMTSPPAGAGADRVAVHAVLPGVVIVTGEQMRPVKVKGDEMIT